MRFVLVLAATLCLIYAQAQTPSWIHTIGGANMQLAHRSEVDGNGNVYIIGLLQGNNIDFDPSPTTSFLLSSAGDRDIFVAKYNRDGIFRWAFKIGGSGRDGTSQVALDGHGGIFVAGYFRGSNVDFDPSSLSAVLTSNGDIGADPGYGGDAFLAKYDTSGNYKWALNIGGTSIYDNAIALTADNAGNAIVGGYFRETADFDPGPGSTILNGANGSCFLAKYNGAGLFQWAFNVGSGNPDESFWDMKTDATDNIYVTGYYLGGPVDMDPGPGTTNLINNGSADIMIAKYSPAGALVWAKGIGGSGWDRSYTLAFDPAGSVYVGGIFFSGSIDFDPGSGTAIANGNGQGQGFLVKLNSAGIYQWTVPINASSGTSYFDALKVDASSNVYGIGVFSGAADFDPSSSTANLSSAGGDDGFVAKYSSTGTYICAGRIGGSSSDAITDLEIAGNDIIITGVFASSNADLDPGPATSTFGTADVEDAFFGKYNWDTRPAAGTLTGGVFCNGTSAQLTFNATAGTGPFTLSINNGTTNVTYNNIVSGTSFSPSPVPVSTTNYTLTSIKDANSCSSTISVSGNTTTITISTISPTISGASTICSGDSTQLTATGGTSYSWSPATGLSATNIANPKASPASTTPYTVTATNAQGCTGTANITVTVNAKPVAAISPAAPSFCPGDSAQLTASGGGTYLWSPAAGLSATNIANPKAAPLATTIYKVVVTNAAGCKDSTTVTVTRKAAPVITTSVSGAICPGDSAQLNAGGGTNYLWSPAATLSNATISNPKAGPLATTIYKVVVTGASGCKDSTNVTVTVNAKPVASVSPAAPSFCPGDSAQLSASGGGTYLWSPATGLSSTTIANPKAAPLVTTIYKVVVTNAAGCKDSTTVTVTRKTAPTITASAGAAVCAGDSAQLSASGGTIYLWSPAATLSNPNSSNPKAGPAATTPYQVVVTNAAGCKDSTTVTVTVKPKPIVTLSPATATICAGDSLQLTATGGGTYLWSPATGLSSISTANPKASPPSTLTYKVVVTGANGCADSLSRLVTVNAKPVINLAPSNSICQGDSLQLSASGGGTYLWSPAAGLSSISTANPKASPAATTIYKVVVTSPLGCVDSALMTLTIKPRPTITISSPATICAGDSTQLNAAGGGSYTWTPAASLSNAAIATPKASPASATNYQVIVTGVNGCSDSARVLITVNPKPVIGLAGTASVCRGDSVQLTASGGGSYLWSPATGLSSTGISNPKASPANTTTYQVLVTNAAGCKDSSSILVTVNSKPVPTITAPTSICTGDTLQLNAGGGTGYLWTPASTLTSGTGPNPRAFPLATTIYKVVVTNAAGCRDSAQTTITVNAKPLLNLGSDTVLCSGASVQLNATLPGALSYQWNNGTTQPTLTASLPGWYWVLVQTPGCITNVLDSIRVDTASRPTVSLGNNITACVFEPVTLRYTGTGISSVLWSTGATTPTIVPTTPETYSIIATNNCGTATDDVVVSFEACNDDIYFPSGFTPNNDGKNDVYHAVHLAGVRVAHYELSIYNRWGERVFYSEILDKGWDGTIGGVPQDSGTFVWFARYRKNLGDPLIVRKGTFVLIR